MNIKIIYRDDTFTEMTYSGTMSELLAAFSAANEYATGQYMTGGLVLINDRLINVNFVKEVIEVV